jgi:IS5 family transposase
MRQKLQHQLALPPEDAPPVEHQHARELAAISDLLDAQPQLLDLVLADLPKGRKNPLTGRPGITAEQVLRALVLKQMHEFSYDDLAFHIADSVSFRSFCRFEPYQSPPKRSTLQANIKRVQAGTLEKINELLVLEARSLGIETGRKVRIDCTVTESNIHEPTDGELLWDVVRVLTRLMAEAKERFGLGFRNRTRRAKRRSLNIWNAKNEKLRKKAYVDLMKATQETLVDARRVEVELRDVDVHDIMDIVHAEALRGELRRFSALGERVGDQTYRRVVLEQKVPAKEKLVSIFEEHADIIVKDRRETLFGHKLCLTTGASGLVLDARVLDGNPSDSTLAVNMIERQERLLGRVPRQAALDGGFSSKANLAAIKELGVEDVCFSKGRGLEITDMVRSAWVYKKLRNFRAGIEGGISFLKRCFGLDRCTWRGLASFEAYTWASIVSANLLLLARRVLAAPT